LLSGVLNSAFGHNARNWRTRPGKAGVASATIVGEERKKLTHGFVVSRVVDKAAFFPPSNQPDPAKVREMERQSGWNHVELLPDGACVYAIVPDFDK